MRLTMAASDFQCAGTGVGDPGRSALDCEIERPAFLVAGEAGLDGGTPLVPTSAAVQTFWADGRVTWEAMARG